MKYVVDFWNNINKEIDKLDVTNLDFTKNHNVLNKVICHPINKSTIYHKRIIEHIEKYGHLKPNIVILEIGAAYGNLCRLINCKYSNIEYYILDTPSMLRLSKTFLKEHDICANFISSENFNNLEDLKFDLTLSIEAIGETPQTYREEVLNIVFKNSKSIWFQEGDSFDKLHWKFLEKQLPLMYNKFKRKNNIWSCYK